MIQFVKNSVDEFSENATNMPNFLAKLLSTSWSNFRNQDKIVERKKGYELAKMLIFLQHFLTHVQYVQFIKTIVMLATYFLGQKQLLKNIFCLQLAQ